MKTQTMYKFTFYDRCCSPIADGTASFFTADLDAFKESFLRLSYDDELNDKFLRALSGETVIDFYSDNPDLNMLQSDTVDIYAEKTFTLDDHTFQLENAYHYDSEIRAVRAEIHVMSIRFKKQYYLIGRYHLYGAASLYPHDEALCYVDVRPVGNPILESLTPAVRTYTNERPARIQAENRRFEKYKDNEIYSICYVPFQCAGKPIGIPDELSGEDFIRLMRDIPGEVG